MLERRPEEWREKQIGLKHHFAHQQPASNGAKGGGYGGLQGQAERKRKLDVEGGVGEDVEGVTDEIDDLFAGVDDGKKSKKRK